MIRRDYLIVGAGLAGSSACEAIREHDSKGSVMVVGAEPYAPYHRSRLFQHCPTAQSPAFEKLQQYTPAWFEQHQVDLRLDTIVTHFNVDRHVAVLGNGQAVEFKKACLAMGARARRPPVAGATLGGVVYLRTLRDVLSLREMMEVEKEVVIVGGGFLAARVAALLLEKPKTKITIVHRGKTLWDKKVDPETAEFLTQQYRERGVKLMLGETLNGFEGRTVVRNVQSKSGERYSAGLVVVAMGCEPNLGLVQDTPLSYPHGTPVNESLETDEKGIYAAGDLAAFPCKILGGVRRFEYWECAVAQGKVAGANMSGKKRLKFEYLPHSTAEALDLHFDFVGDFSKPPARVQFEGDRSKKKFIARYFQPNGLMGILLCNQSAEKTAAAKEELRASPRVKTRESL